MLFAALGELKDHYAIVPGKPDESKMVYRITNEDPNVRMPPPVSNLMLTEYEKKGSCKMDRTRCELGIPLVFYSAN